jgi:hypothetical protein
MGRQSSGFGLDQCSHFKAPDFSLVGSLVDWALRRASSQNLNQQLSFSGFPSGPSADRVVTWLARFRFLPQYSS